MSVSENTTNDLRVATMLLKKIGETFQELQSHSFSILTLGEQWESLQNSIGTIHNSVEEKVKVVESKDREINMNRIRLQNFKKEVEVRQKKLEFEENSLKQRIEGVQMREKQVKEWCECLELQRSENAERSKALEVCEKRFAEGLERVKAVDAKEVRVSEWRKAVEERENEVDERRKAVEERENEVEEQRRVVEEREREVGEREVECCVREKEATAAAEKVGLREEVMNERGDALNAKERKLKEFSGELNRRFVVLEEKEEELGLTEKEMDELFTAVRLKEMENDGISKMLASKEKEIDELRENSLKEVELRENAVNERMKEVEMREEQMNEKIDAFEAKVAQIDEVCKGMEVKRREKADMKATIMEEVMVMKGEIEERRKAVEERETRMDDRCRELDCREKMLNKRSKVSDNTSTLGYELTSSALAKTREPKPVAYCEIQLLCMNMDTNGMRSYLTKLHYKDIYKMRDKISDSLQLTPDPAKLVLNVIQSFYELVESENMPRQVYIASCIALSGALMKINTSIPLHLKADAMKFSITWRDFFAKQGYTHRLDSFAFLQFLATYDLAQSYDADELFSHLGAFYTEIGVLQPGLYLCRILRLEKKIPGFIQSLITREEKLQAVVYICAFKLEDAFPPVPLLKGHLECVQKRVQNMVKKGSDRAQNDAVYMELSALRALLKCISNFKLESSFSPAPLEFRLKQLEKETEGKANAETLLTVKKYISDSEMKGVALPGFDQSHLAIGKKRTLNSMESRNQGKILKVNACQMSISKNPVNLPATN